MRDISECKGEDEGDSDGVMSFQKPLCAWQRRVLDSTVAKHYRRGARGTGV